MEIDKNTPPILKFGKYTGTAIDQVPSSYCRWLLTQDFPEDIIWWAKKKVESNSTIDLEMDITRHAIDTFSLRFMSHWESFNDKNNVKVGFGSYLAQQAILTLDEGKDISKNRHQDEQIIKFYKGISWVFNKNGEYKNLITVY